MKNIFIFLIILSFSSCQQTPSPEKINKIFQADIGVLTQDIIQLKALVNSDSSTSTIQKQFLKAHQSFK